MPNVSIMTIVKKGSIMTHNPFTLAVITMFFLASAVEVCRQNWLQASFLALSGLINVVVAIMAR